MEIQYTPKTDILYLRLDDQKQQVINRRVSEEIVLDVGKDDRIVGIEIIDASHKVDLYRLELKAMPITTLIMSEMAVEEKAG